MTDRELMQDALDALEHLQTDIEWQYKSPTRAMLRKVEKALRARLAQPEPAECDGGQCGIGGYCKQCPKTQPEQEPVKDWVVSHNEICVLLRQAHDALALTSYPPKREWVGLTDDEIEQAAQGGDTNFWDFCRIIEAKLKEKNA